MGLWEGDAWHWELGWNDNLTPTETENAAYLLSLLHSVQIKRNERDRRRWTAYTAGLFYVQTAYTALMNNKTDPAATRASSSIFKELWLNNVPSKITTFGWRLLLDKLPTREALFWKGIITNDQERSCVFLIAISLVKFRRLFSGG
jgi:hypothetical protein